MCIPADSYERLHEAKRVVKRSNNEHLKKKDEEVTRILNNTLQRSVTLAREKGGSTWLSVLPIQEHGFALNKGNFVMQSV